MNKLWNDSLTGIDGTTIDPWRVLTIIGVASYILYAGWSLLYDHKFSALEYGTGLGALLFGGGAGVSIKSKTEPGASGQG